MMKSLGICSRARLCRVAAALLVGFLAIVGGLTPAAALFAAGEGDSESTALLEGPPQVVVEATSLVHSSMTATEVAQRDKLLARAQGILETYLKDNPTHPDAVFVEMQLGVVHTTAGKADLSDSRQVETQADRDALLGLSRERFRAAEKLFTTVVDQLDQRTRPKGFEENEKVRREALRIKGEYIKAQMFHAGVLEELAGTYPPGSAEARENYQAAADRYDRIYKNYRTLVSGLVARLKQGICYNHLGDARRALGLYNDLLSQPDDLKDLHRLRVSAMYLSLECWTGEKEKLYELAFSQGEEYLTHLPREEELWPEWQGVRYYTARGYMLAATKKPGGAANADRTEWLAKARVHAETLAKRPGPYKAAVEELLAELGKAEAGSGDGAK